MMADLFFNYAIPIILIVNVIAVISLGVDYFRDRKSNLKKNFDGFKTASLELCDKLERFHNDSKKSLLRFSRLYALKLMGTLRRGWNIT